uniref:Uncharacterized protein n=1 Tax=Picea glauca TaxID=3330 RepID=A0A117NJ00_PICGL|nr:hypothetical protein ABT39_MTgene607 [Picea glauca]
MTSTKPLGYRSDRNCLSLLPALDLSHCGPFIPSLLPAISLAIYRNHWKNRM